MKCAKLIYVSEDDLLLCLSGEIRLDRRRLPPDLQVERCFHDGLGLGMVVTSSEFPPTAEGCPLEVLPAAFQLVRPRPGFNYSPRFSRDGLEYVLFASKEIEPGEAFFLDQEGRVQNLTPGLLQAESDTFRSVLPTAELLAGMEIEPGETVFLDQAGRVVSRDKNPENAITEPDESWRDRPSLL